MKKVLHVIWNILEVLIIIYVIALTTILLAKNKFGFTQDMANAVKFHTTGRENMTILEKVIYLADATEENRKYCSSVYVDLIKKDINDGMFEVAKWVINSLLERNMVIHLDTIRCYNFYNKNL